MKRKNDYTDFYITFQVLNFVRVAVQSRKVFLMSIDKKIGDATWYNIPVDTKLQEFTVSISGAKPRLHLVDPNGRLIHIVIMHGIFGSYQATRREIPD